jgi:hypothetical protein
LGKPCDIRIKIANLLGAYLVRERPGQPEAWYILGFSSHDEFLTF